MRSIAGIKLYIIVLFIYNVLTWQLTDMMAGSVGIKWIYLQNTQRTGYIVNFL